MIQVKGLTKAFGKRYFYHPGVAYRAHLGQTRVEHLVDLGPRLTTTLVLWLIYVAYLMLRAFVEEEEREARFAAYTVVWVVLFGLASEETLPGGGISEKNFGRKISSVGI